MVLLTMSLGNKDLFKDWMIAIKFCPVVIFSLLIIHRMCTAISQIVIEKGNCMGGMVYQLKYIMLYNL